MKGTEPRRTPIPERISMAVGSPLSLALHTLAFVGFFVAVVLGLVALETMLLVLTTVVSLEAIYLAIFIQMGVNENTRSLRVVEEDLDEIQEDVEELGEDLDEIQEDLEEISEDVEGIQEDIDEIQEDVEELSEEDKEEEQREQRQAVTLEQLTDNVRRILEDLEALKKGK
jgi:septal ring factor EnvC (AmiA/AmiB activator)